MEIASDFVGDFRMKKIMVAAVAVAAFCSAPVLAADMPTKNPVYKTAAAPVFNWTGFYVGADAGYLWSDTAWTYPGVGGVGTSRPEPKDFLAGGHVGYRYQFPSNIVAGIELDASHIFGGKTSAPIPGPSPAGQFLDLKWTGSVRGQLGVASGPLLAYVTGGAAVIALKGCTQATVGAPCIAGDIFSDDRWGWTIGGGLDYALAGNWSARVEYLFADYGARTYATGAGAGLVRVDLRTNVVRGGLSYKFGSY